MATTFMAVQCFNCFTMQVKQRKKSSNKWTCVVCNEKQSVRMVYATNSMAKHVRSFVQSFNMSRKFADDECLNHQTLTEEQIPNPLNYDNCKRKSMTDWTAYLDQDEQDNAPPPATEEDTHGPKIVTELPVEMFKKRRAMRSDPRGRGQVYTPNFSKRLNSTAADTDCGVSSQDAAMKSKNVVISAGCKEGGSRWTAYLTQEEEDFNAHPGNCSADIDIARGSEAFTEQQVEEDIHPDFK